MYNYISSPTVSNCTLSGNSTTGMFNDSNSNPTVSNCTMNGNSRGMENNPSSSPTVSNCTMNGNSNTGMYNQNSSSPTVTNCTLSGNTATNNGGGMVNNSSSPTMTNCSFNGNSAGSSGGGMYNWNNSNPTVTNCILWENFDSGGMDESAQIHTVSGTPVVNYSDVQGGWTGAGGTGNIDANPLFIDPNGLDDIPGTEDDDLRLLAGSPCIDAGISISGISPDLDGNARLVDDPATTDTGLGFPPIDMGAYEFGSSPGGLLLK